MRFDPPGVETGCNCRATAGQYSLQQTPPSDLHRVSPVVPCHIEASATTGPGSTLVGPQVHSQALENRREFSLGRVNELLVADKGGGPFLDFLAAQIAFFRV